MAADAGVFIAWDKVATGREKKAMEVWGDALTFYEKAKANGEIEDYQLVGFTASSSLGVLGGIAVTGTEEVLDKFTASQGFARQMQRASLVVNQLHVSRYITGARMLETAGSYFQEIDALLG